jgi:hypothetical protein
MHCAINCASSGLYANLRLFLSAFHSQKRLREVDAMLLRLYNPIIWRWGRDCVMAYLSQDSTTVVSVSLAVAFEMMIVYGSIFVPGQRC